MFGCLSGFYMYKHPQCPQASLTFMDLLLLFLPIELMYVYVQSIWA